MPNVLLTIDMITREAILLWKNTNAFLQHVDMQYDDQYALTGAKIGTNLRIRLPNDFVVRTGAAASIQDTAEQSSTLTVATQKGVDMSYNSVDRTMKLDDFSRRIMAPAVNNLAGSVAADLMAGSEGGVCNYVSNVSGGATISPTSATILNASATLDINSAPMDERYIVDDPFTDARVTSSLSGLFNPAPVISKQYTTGRMKDALGFLWMKDQTVIKHTNGAFISTTVNGANQTGLSLVVAALAQAINIGDIITIGSTVFGVNKITKQSTGQLKQFVATANCAIGATTIPIYPAIVPGGGGYNPTTGDGAQQYQTVTNSPANGATVLPVGVISETYRKNIAFHPQAVTMATADLVQPQKSVEECHREEFDGVSMRMLSQYNAQTDQFISRLDILYGYLYIRPEWACIIADAV